VPALKLVILDSPLDLVLSLVEQALAVFQDEAWVAAFDRRLIYHPYLECQLLGHLDWQSLDHVGSLVLLAQDDLECRLVQHPTELWVQVAT
jgi:hypothetical protein